MSPTLSTIPEKHCGSKFPERVVSSGRSLWMRFESDLSIEYRGFRAAYSHIRDPKPRMANVGECSFNVSGDQVSAGGKMKFSKHHVFTYIVPVSEMTFLVVNCSRSCSAMPTSAAS